MIRTANPALRADVFTTAAQNVTLTDQPRTMTIQGTVNKTLMLLILLVAAAGWTWYQFINKAEVMPWMIGGIIVGLIAAVITCFVPRAAPVTAPIYAVAEGLVLGGISAMMQEKYPGIAFSAAALTMGVLGAMLMAYTFRIVRATEKFKMGVVAATMAIALVYLAGFVLSFFHISIPYIHTSGPIGIIFSLVVVVIAALNLVLDFDFIEQGAASGAPRYMEWYGAFGLLVTLVWLYLEILRLLAKLRER